LIMEITRDVILDLLPLYLAGEVSSDTRTLIEEYIQKDPQLANFVEQSKAMQLPEDIPIPLKKEHQMETYKEAKRLQLQRTIIWAVVISVIILAVLGLASLAAFFLISA